MKDKKIVPNENEVELNDEQLDSVSGGLFIQGVSLTCSKCGKKFSSNGERETHEKTCKG